MITYNILVVSFTDGPAEEKRAKKSSATYVAIIAETLSGEELAAAEQCGAQLAQRLVNQGAEAILREAKTANEQK